MRIYKLFRYWCQKILTKSRFWFTIILMWIWWFGLSLIFCLLFKTSEKVLKDSLDLIAPGITSVDLLEEEDLETADMDNIIDCFSISEEAKAKWKENKEEFRKLLLIRKGKLAVGFRSFATLVFNSKLTKGLAVTTEEGMRDNSIARKELLKEIKETAKITKPSEEQLEMIMNLQKEWEAQSIIYWMNLLFFCPSRFWRI